jgi:hypothetical protein
MFTEYSLNVHRMFTECSLNVRWADGLIVGLGSDAHPDVLTDVHPEERKIVLADGSLMTPSEV